MLLGGPCPAHHAPAAFSDPTISKKSSSVMQAISTAFRGPCPSMCTRATGKRLVGPISK